MLEEGLDFKSAGAFLTQLRPLDSGNVSATAAARAASRSIGLLGGSGDDSISQLYLGLEATIGLVTAGVYILMLSFP